MPRSVSPAPRDSDLLPDGQSATTVVYTAYRERPVTQAPRDSDLLLDGQSATAVLQAGLAGEAEAAPAAAAWVPGDIPSETAVWTEANHVEVEYETDVEDESEDPLRFTAHYYRSPFLPYLALATNNLESLLQDELGAVCVFCFENPQVTPDTETTDDSTAICSICHIDALVPASAVPDNATLREWHSEGFDLYELAEPGA